jgi:EmrB/QacA subfamily drug resistance transporter
MLPVNDAERPEAARVPSLPMTAATQIRPRWILTAVILASGIVFLDSTIVNVALPRIALELPTSVLGTLEAQAYVTSGYLAMLSATLILAGALGDRYGRRRVFIIGLVAFGLTSALCGLAPTMELLVVFRLLQGMAGALLVPGPLSIITATFEGGARARAIGLWSAATSALTILGPLAGGLVVDSLSWRLAFLVNVPLVLVALYAAVRYVPESRNEDAPRRLDWLGSLVIAVAVGGISFGLIRGQEQRWSDPTTTLVLIIGIVAAIAFPVLMIKRRDPLVPPALFRNRAFTVINISTFLIYGALYISSFLQSVYLQGVLGYTALGAAALSLPAGILLTLFSTRVGVAAARIGAWSLVRS